MEVGNVIIGCGCAAVVIGQTVWHPDVVVGEVQRLGRAALGDHLPQELAAGVDVAVVCGNLCCRSPVERALFLCAIRISMTYLLQPNADSPNRAETHAMSRNLYHLHPKEW